MAQRNQGALVTTAETIGTSLGQLARRVDALKKQRAQIEAEIQRALDQGQKLLRRLRPDRADEAPESNDNSGRKRYQPPEVAQVKLKGIGTRKNRAKASVSAKEHTKPDDIRAAVRATAPRTWSNRQPGRG